MPGKLDEELIKKIQELCKQGYNYKEISISVGVAHSTAMKYCKRDNETEVHYRERLLFKKGIQKSFRSHKNKLAINRGYNSNADYNDSLLKKRIKKYPYKKLSLIVSRRIEQIKIFEGKNQRQIARDCHLTKQYLSAIKLGKHFPQGKYLDRLCNGLRLKKSALEKLLKRD